MSDPTPACVAPNAPKATCTICGADVSTCERDEPVRGWDYRCPAHPDAVETQRGWVCSAYCYDKAVDRE